MHHGTSEFPYRVGLGRALHKFDLDITEHGRKTAVRFLVHQFRAHGLSRSFWGFWQAEWEGCDRAVRGLTQEHCWRRACRVRAAQEQQSGGGAS